MIYGPLDFHLFGVTVDFLSCWFGDFLPRLASITLQPRQPLPRVLHLSYTRISVLPEEEKGATS